MSSAELQVNGVALIADLSGALVWNAMETIVVADDSASPAFCAADLIAQAEHDPMATAILVTNSEGLLKRVEEELDLILDGQGRGEVARSALDRRGRAVLVESLEEGVDLVNRIAPEHLCLMVEDPWAWVDRVRNAGGLFLGEFSPEVMGDYIAGPSHVMPTAGTARFASGLGVHSFIKHVPVVALEAEKSSELGRIASIIGRAEGLTGHAEAAEVREEL